MIVGDAHRDVPCGVGGAVGNGEDRQVTGTGAARGFARRDEVEIVAIREDEERGGLRLPPHHAQERGDGGIDARGGTIGDSEVQVVR